MAKRKTIADALRKLDRPPAGPNWARFIWDSPEATGKAMVRFALGMPQITYLSASRAIRDKIELGISDDAVIRAASLGGSPLGRTTNRELAAAFLGYEAERRYSAANPVGFDPGYFRVSRDVVVPVGPLSVIREAGKFVPIFLCGWASNPLTFTQRRLLMTLYEDGFLSLTDYLGSPAEVLFFPKEDIDGEKIRLPEVWHRGDYPLLNEKELKECLEIFSEGRELARSILLAKAAEERDRPSEETVVVSGGPDLFS